MKVQQWSFVDKSTWAPGPWNFEPDKVQWPDAFTGYPCLAHRGPQGAWCGYVGVAEGHPWFGVEYAGIDLELGGPHGGLTFSDFCAPEVAAGGEGICHIVEPGEPDRVWWVGFDCSHAGDLSPVIDALMREHGTLALYERLPDQYRTLDFVKAQCHALAVQADLAARPGFKCPKCGRTSFNPTDRVEGYCGACREWTGKATT